MFKWYGVTPLFLIFGKINGYIEDDDGTKYLTLIHDTINILKKQKKKQIRGKVKGIIVLKCSILNDFLSSNAIRIKVNFDYDDFKITNNVFCCESYWIVLNSQKFKLLRHRFVFSGMIIMSLSSDIRHSCGLCLLHTPRKIILKETNTVDISQKFCENC